jgi:hypothetical protein
MAKGSAKKSAPPAADDLLLEPALVALRKRLEGPTQVREQQVPLDQPADTQSLLPDTDGAGTVSIRGSGATEGAG